MGRPLTASFTAVGSMWPIRISASLTLALRVVLLPLFAAGEIVEQACGLLVTEEEVRHIAVAS